MDLFLGRRLVMSVQFADFLNEISADADMLQQALRIYLSERTGDLTPDEMTSELRARATDEKEFSNTLKRLEKTPEAVEQAALTYFEREWEDEVQRPSIRAVFDNAKNQLPVVETAIIAIAAMYAIHMIATKGVVERETVTRRKRDGTFETSLREKLEPFHPIISAIPRLLGATTRTAGNSDPVN
jgi:hypothetical protein